MMDVHMAANQALKSTLTDVVMGEFQRMTYTMVLEDKALEGADPAVAWLIYHERVPELETSSRVSFFISFDKESIGRLARAPTDEELTAMTRDEKTLAWDTWVKNIATTGHVDTNNKSDDPVGTGFSEIPWHIGDYALLSGSTRLKRRRRCIWRRQAAIDGTSSAALDSKTAGRFAETATSNSLERTSV
jgi:hypothetical protein